MPCRRECGLPRRFAPRNDMQKFATCSHNTGALPVCRRKNVLATHPHGKFLRTPRIKHPCTRRTATAFCMSLRASAHTGVAIRSPRRETWQVGNTLGEFVPIYEFALNSALFTPCRRSYGLPRRCAPRNDMQKHAAVCGCNCVVPGKFVTFSYSP